MGLEPRDSLSWTAGIGINNGTGIGSSIGSGKGHKGID